MAGLGWGGKGQKSQAIFRADLDHLDLWIKFLKLNGFIKINNTFVKTLPFFSNIKYL